MIKNTSKKDIEYTIRKTVLDNSERFYPLFMVFGKELFKCCFSWGKRKKAHKKNLQKTLEEIDRLIA